MGRIDLTGKKFTRLTVIKFVYVNKQRHAVWECKCDCGKIINVVGANLRRHTIKSCGCWKKDVHKIKGKNIKHGLRATRFYRTWAGMKTRCLNEKDGSYLHYGGRGILLYIPWVEFINFKDDMYESYLKHCNDYSEKNTTIERIDVNGNYEPCNCTWATRKEQATNRRPRTKNINHNKKLLKSI